MKRLTFILEYFHGRMFEIKWYMMLWKRTKHMESSLLPGYKCKFSLNFVFYLVRNTNDIHIFWVLTMGQASSVHHFRCGIANGRHYVSLSWLEQTSALLKYVFSYLFWTWFQKPSQHCSPPHSSSYFYRIGI